MHRRDGNSSSRHSGHGMDCADDVVLDLVIDMRKRVKNTEMVAVMKMCIAPKVYEGVSLGNHGIVSPVSVTYCRFS